MPRRVVLVNPPFQPLSIPSTGLSYVYSAAAGAGHDVRVADLNYPLARHLLPSMPGLAAHWEASHPAHAGQLLFSILKFPEQRTSPRLAATIRAVEIAHRVRVDEVVERAREHIDAWLDAQRFDSADVVAFTLLNYQLLAGLYLVDQVRRRAPHAKIVAGGFYVSPENGHALMQHCPDLDLCVHGEGEKTFLELLARIDEPEAWPDILGLAYRDARGAPCVNAARPLLTGPELDELPLPRYDWVSPEDFEHFKVSIPVVSIRGCYWGKCTFCSDFRFNKITYARSPESVVREMEWQAERHRTSRFYFSDLASNDSIERINAIADGLAASKHRFEFTMLFVPDNVDLPMLRRLKAAGCQSIQYGIESLSNRLLKKMAKSPRVFDNLRAIKLTELAGMQALSNIIKYFPTETLDEVADNYDLVARYPELLNGYVFARPVTFRSRQAASITRLLVRRDYKSTERAVHAHYWPEELSRSLPDIEYVVEIRSENQALHDFMWKRVEDLLEENMQRRAVTRFEDDGRTLRLTKYDLRERQATTYELRDLGRNLYLMLEDAARVDELGRRLGVDEDELARALDMLLEAGLIVRDGDRVLATINPNVAELTLDPLTTTADARPTELSASEGGVACPA